MWQWLAPLTVTVDFVQPAEENQVFSPLDLNGSLWWPCLCLNFCHPLGSVSGAGIYSLQTLWRSVARKALWARESMLNVYLCLLQPAMKKCRLFLLQWFDLCLLLWPVGRKMQWVESCGSSTPSVVTELLIQCVRDVSPDCSPSLPQSETWDFIWQHLSFHYYYF